MVVMATQKKELFGGLGMSFLLGETQVCHCENGRATSFFLESLNNRYNSLRSERYFSMKLSFVG